MAQRKPKLPRGIDLLPSGKYRARVTFDGKQIGIGVFQTIGDANAARSIALSEIARDIFVLPAQRRAQRIAAEQARKQVEWQNTTTVNDLATAWLTWLENLGRSTGTIYTYERRLKQSFLPAFGDTPLATLTVDDVTHWYNALIKSSGEGVAKQHYRTVDGMFRYATGQSRGVPRSFQQWIKESPVDIPGAGTHKPTPGTEQIVLTTDEIQHIADNMPSRERLGVLLAGHCALRIGEVLGLRRRDLSTDHQGTMWLNVNEQVQARGTGVRLDPPKTQAGYRDVPIPTFLSKTVTTHLDDYVSPAADSFLFPRTQIGNRPHHPNTFRAHFNTARDALENSRFNGLTFHGLRHSCLTRLGRAGATLADLMAYAGHSDVESVLIYQHSEKQRLAALAEQLSTDLGA